MDDVSQNIRNDAQEPYRPSRAEVEEWATEHLQEGLEPDRDENGDPMGPAFDGFEETLTHVRDMYAGAFTESEFAEVARGAFEDALSEVVEDGETDLDAEAHRTLDGFGAKRLKFSRSLIPDLLDGSKTATVRYELEQDLRPGEPLLLETPGLVELFAEATVGDVIRTELGDALDAIADEGYQHNAESVADLWATLNLYYEDDLGLSTEVAVVLLDDVTEVA